jgi:hypothetical protein
MKLIESDGTKASNLVRLYKVMGGGWNMPANEKENESKDKGNENEGKV